MHRSRASSPTTLYDTDQRALETILEEHGSEKKWIIQVGPVFVRQHQHQHPVYLVDGFLPLHAWVYQVSRQLMQSIVTELQAQNVPVHYV
jgi:hypothetical protein